MAGARTINVFIASPGDLAVERRAFKEVIDQLNDGFAAGAGVEFVPLGWEDLLSDVGRRPQDVINKDVDRCDVFILMMWKRWGDKHPDIPHPATSRTEEEYLRASERRKKSQSPRIFVFFKNVATELLGDPGPQLKKVLAFKRKLEKSGIVIYRNFPDEGAFRCEIDLHLRSVAKPDDDGDGHGNGDGDGGPPPSAVPLRPVDLPVERIQELERALAEAEKRTRRAEAAFKRLKASTRTGRKHRQAPRKVAETLALARADESALKMAEQAAKAAVEGRVEQARQIFAKAHQGTDDLRVLSLAFQFYRRIGDLAAAEEMCHRRLAISGPEADRPETALALRNLALIFHQRGELDKAEAMFRKSLDIEKRLGHEEGIASCYGNLGLVYESRGKLSRAEEMFKKSLAISQRLGREKSVANQYGNLGSLYRRKGRLAQAEKMLRKSLAIEEKLGHQEGMAADYSNLAGVYLARNALDEAEDMLKKALVIDEKLGASEGVATCYSNLGLIFQKRGKPEEARQQWLRARKVFAKIGMPHMVKQMQDLLNRLPDAKEKQVAPQTRLPKPGKPGERRSAVVGSGRRKRRV